MDNFTIARTEDYEFFDRTHYVIGVRAYQHSPIWRIILDYLEMQEKLDDFYGKYRLATLVDEEMAQRFDSALMKFRVTIMRTNSNDKKTWKELEDRKEICKRGLIAMDSYVKENGLFQPFDIWVNTTLGFTIAVVKDENDLLKAKELRKDVNAFYTFKEVIELIRGMDTINSVKKQLDAKGLKDNQVVNVLSTEEEEEYFNDKVPF